jgi:hypothetical protein
VPITPTRFSLATNADGEKNPTVDVDLVLLRDLSLETEVDA